jgi:hypothetical protein
MIETIERPHTDRERTKKDIPFAIQTTRSSRKDRSRLFNFSLDENVRRAIDIRQDQRSGLEGAFPQVYFPKVAKN